MTFQSIFYNTIFLTNTNGLEVVQFLALFIILTSLSITHRFLILSIIELMKQFYEDHFVGFCTL